MSNRNKVGRLAALEERIARQDEELARMREELAEVRSHTTPSMRRTGRCPSCGGGRLLHIARPTELAHAGIAQQAMHHTSGFWGMKTYGPVEHFVCRNCLLIESHAKNLDGLEPDGKEILAIEPEPEPEPPGGPYR